MEHNKIKKLTEKIQKLLNLSRDAGATENERATALKFATKLMDKHNINAIDAEEFENDPRDKGSVLIGSHPWKASVFDAIGTMYGCKMWRTKGPTGKIFIIGTESVRNIVTLMGDYVIDSIEKESRYIPTSGKRASTSFKNGAASGLYDQVHNIIEARKAGDEEIPEEKALVLASFYETEQEKNDDFFASLGMTLQKGVKTRITDSEAFSQGHSYGKQVSLNNQIGNSNDAPRLT